MRNSLKEQIILWYFSLLMVTWLPVSGPVVRQNITIGSNMVEQRFLPHGGQEAEVGEGAKVSISPSRAHPH
jgi:hypothetical protein